LAPKRDPEDRGAEGLPEPDTGFPCVSQLTTENAMSPLGTQPTMVQRVWRTGIVMDGLAQAWALVIQSFPARPPAPGHGHLTTNP
jgi:hypothetical protein